MTVKKMKRHGIARRTDRPFGLSMIEARQITGDIGVGNNKLPGYDYNLPASACVTGSELVNKKNSVCAGCYAMEGAFLWSHVHACHQRRLESIVHPEWVNAMATLIDRACVSEIDANWFRWHSSGDLMSVEHLRRIVTVAKLTPKVHYWLPTRECGIVVDFIDWETFTPNPFPPNLVVRISAHYIDQMPVEWLGLPTSTVNSIKGMPVQVSMKRKDSIECRAYTRRNKCATCRACWSPKVANVSYSLHGVRALTLRMVA